MRKDRRGYERNTNVGTNDLHLGGGGGEGVLSGNREFVSREGNAHEDERTPFDVIRGGRACSSFGLTSNNRSTFSAKRSPLVSASPCSRSQPAGVRPVRQASSLSLCASGHSGRCDRKSTRMNSSP